MLDKLNISTYIVWNSNNQEQIESDYQLALRLQNERS